MKIESKEVRQALRAIRRKYSTKMKFVFQAYSEFGTDYDKVDVKVKELHEAEFGTIPVPDSVAL